MIWDENQCNLRKMHLFSAPVLGVQSQPLSCWPEHSHQDRPRPVCPGERAPCCKTPVSFTPSRYPTHSLECLSHNNLGWVNRINPHTNKGERWCYCCPLLKAHLFQKQGACQFEWVLKQWVLTTQVAWRHSHGPQGSGSRPTGINRGSSYLHVWAVYKLVFVKLRGASLDRTQGRMVTKHELNGHLWNLTIQVFTGSRLVFTLKTSPNRLCLWVGSPSSRLLFLLNCMVLVPAFF